MKPATQRESPALWPYKWFLPVSRIGGDGFWNDDDLGLITHDNGVIRPVVYVGNMLDVKSKQDLETLPKEEFDSAEAIFEKWRVD